MKRQNSGIRKGLALLFILVLAVSAVAGSVSCAQESDPRFAQQEAACSGILADTLSGLNFLVGHLRGCFRRLVPDRDTAARPTVEIQPLTVITPEPDAEWGPMPFEAPMTDSLPHPDFVDKDLFMLVSNREGKLLERANFRKGPDVYAERIGRLEKDTVVFVYYTIVSGSYEYWSFIRADGQYGYVMSRYLHLIYEPVGRAPGFRGQVTRQGFIR